MFITISVDRSSIVYAVRSKSAWRPGPFGEVVAGRMVLNELGTVVWNALESMGVLNPGIHVFGRVVMPDHVHFNVHLDAGLVEPLKVLGKAISRFKNHTIKQSKILAARCSATSTGEGGVLGLGTVERNRPVASEDGRAVRVLSWQQGYHDRLCLRREFIDATERYIAYNPLKWFLMYEEPSALTIHEPLDSPRLDAADYWKGVGNLALLAKENKIVSLRVSRHLKTRAQIEAVVKRMEKAVDAGFTVLSGFISPGEKMVRDMLVSRDDARFIRILPSCLPNRRYRPESRYVAAFAANQYLEIARGNDDVEFGRSACLDYNSEIVEIAKAGEGLAVYFKMNGVEKL